LPQIGGAYFSGRFKGWPDAFIMRRVRFSAFEELFRITKDVVNPPPSKI
jgi:hypothetical protein